MKKMFVIIVDFLLNYYFFVGIVSFIIFFIVYIKYGKKAKDSYIISLLLAFLMTVPVVALMLFYTPNGLNIFSIGRYRGDENIYRLKYIKERNYINFTKKYCLEKLGFSENVNELLNLDEDSLNSIIYSLDTMLLIKNNKNLTDDEKEKLLDEISSINDGFDKRIFYVDREIDRTEKKIDKYNYEKILQEVK